MCGQTTFGKVLSTLPTSLCSCCSCSPLLVLTAALEPLRKSKYVMSAAIRRVTGQGTWAEGEAKGGSPGIESLSHPPAQQNPHSFPFLHEIHILSVNGVLQILATSRSVLFALAFADGHWNRILPRCTEQMHFN